MAESEELLYEKGGVFIHTTVARADEDALVEGKIIIKHTAEGVFIEWKYVPAVVSSNTHKDNEWTVLDPCKKDNKVSNVGYQPKHPERVTVKTKQQSKTAKSPKTKEKEKAEEMSAHRYIINFKVIELKSFKRSKPNLGWSYIIFIMQDGSTYPALHFHKGGTKQFIEELKKYLVIKKSPNDSCLYLVREQDPHALSTSFDELQLFDKDQAHTLVSKFFHDPYTQTLSGFSKVTNLLKGALLEPVESHGGHSSFTEMFNEDFAGIGLQLDKEPDDETGFEIVERREKLPPRPDIRRAGSISPQRWSYHMDQEGRVRDKEELFHAIFKGGVDPSIRIEVWKFLLGYYTWDSTYPCRTEERKRKVDSYFQMKLQWKSISPEQEKRFSLLKERKNLIDKDVNRTDRTHDFFKGDENPNLAVLYDILMTYCMYNFDLGYVQGMSDLLSPILVVTENEVDAFWCFAGFMERVADNFTMDQAGMKKQLSDLHLLVKFIDPELCNHLESHDSSNMFFCFRWLLIVFKREFTFSDIMRLWEVLWTDLPCRNFHFLISLAILDTNKATLIDNNFGFTEILKHINDLSFLIDLEDTLKKAEGMYLQVKTMKHVPDTIKIILGLDCDGLTQSNGDASQTDKTSSASSTPSHATPGGSTPSTPEKLATCDAVTSEKALYSLPDDTSIEIVPESREMDLS